MRRPSARTLAELVAALAAERLPDDHAQEPGEATAAIEALTPRDLWRYFRRLERWVHAAREIVGGKPANGGLEHPDDFTRL